MSIPGVIVTLDAAALGVAVVLAADFENVVTTGQIFTGALLGLVALSAAIFGVKWKATGEAALALAQARGEALEDAKEREADLQSALATSKEANAQLRQSVERLEALPNLARILDAMNEHAKHEDQAAADRLKLGLELVEAALDKRLTRHEETSAERHAQLLEQGAQLLEQGSEIVTALQRLNGKG